ncbi:unnamed protein product [Soboliphyme baturini]|uniref:RRM domain-containing protein n=1 Tax=Soboliphyme baturini TaxID=241478 RepID=A0A183ITA1_9BILA|nr:unnamed protein product [Soboliphyme baturini]
MSEEVSRCEKKNLQQKAAYDKCLDDIAQHVAKALVDQDHLKKECDRLNSRVIQLEWENRLLRAQMQFSLQSSEEVSRISERNAGCSVNSRLFSSAVFCNSSQIEPSKDLALCSPQSNAGEGLFSRPVSFCLDKYTDFNAVAKVINSACGDGGLNAESMKTLDDSNDDSLPGETLPNENDYCTDEIKNFSRISEECTVSHAGHSSVTALSEAVSGCFVNSRGSSPFKSTDLALKVQCPTSGKNAGNDDGVEVLTATAGFSFSSCSDIADMKKSVNVIKDKDSVAMTDSAVSMKPCVNDSDMCPQVNHIVAKDGTGTEPNQKLQVLVHMLHSVKNDFPLHDKLPSSKTSLYSCLRKCMPLKQYALDDGYSTMSSEIHADSLPLLYSSWAQASFLPDSLSTTAAAWRRQLTLPVAGLRLTKSCEHFGFELESNFHSFAGVRCFSDSALCLRKLFSNRDHITGRTRFHRRLTANGERCFLEPFLLPNFNMTWPEDGGEALSEFADNEENVNFHLLDCDRSDSSSNVDCGGRYDLDSLDIGECERIKTSPPKRSSETKPSRRSAVSDKIPATPFAAAASAADIDSSLSSHDVSSNRDSKMSVVRYIPPGIRPSVLRHDIFGRFGTEEKVALASFDFLNYYDTLSCSSESKLKWQNCEHHRPNGKRRRTRSLDNSLATQLDKNLNANLYENLPFHLHRNQLASSSKATASSSMTSSNSPLCRSRWRSHCSSVSSLRSSHSCGSSLFLSDLCAADQTLSSCSSLSFQF